MTPFMIVRVICPFNPIRNHFVACCVKSAFKLRRFKSLARTIPSCSVKPRYVILALIGTAAGRQTVIVLKARTEDIVVPVGIRAVRVVYGLSLNTPVLVFLVSDSDEILRS